MIKEGTRVRHFKGMEYTVLAIAKHTETGEDLVIYKADYGEGQVYARPFSMFIVKWTEKNTQM